MVDFDRILRNHNKRKIRRLYVDEGKQILEISIEVGLGVSVVRAYLDSLGVLRPDDLGTVPATAEGGRSRDGFKLLPLLATIIVCTAIGYFWYQVRFGDRRAEPPEPPRETSNTALIETLLKTSSTEFMLVRDSYIAQELDAGPADDIEQQLDRNLDGTWRTQVRQVDLLEEMILRADNDPTKALRALIVVARAKQRSPDIDTYVRNCLQLYQPRSAGSGPHPSDHFVLQVARIRETACLAAARLGMNDEKTIQLLEVLLEDQSIEVRRAALRAFETLKPQNAQSLLVTLRALSANLENSFTLATSAEPKAQVMAARLLVDRVRSVLGGADDVAAYQRTQNLINDFSSVDSSLSRALRPQVRRVQLYDADWQRRLTIEPF